MLRFTDKKKGYLGVWRSLAIATICLCLFAIGGCSSGGANDDPETVSIEEDVTEIALDVTDGTQNMEITAATETLTLNGAIASTATLTLRVEDGDTPLTIYLNKVNVSGENGSSIISCVGDRELRIVTSGENLLQGVNAVAISCPSSNIYFEGDGSLRVLGGNGLDGNSGVERGESGTSGGNGFEAVVANKIYVNMNNSLYLTGGHGGNGGEGAPGSLGTNGKVVPTEALGDTQVGGDGGHGGNGGNGGMGGDAIKATVLNVTAGTLILKGGNGGNGADGGNGGKGGKGGANGLMNYKGGYPGSGGNGGNGGDAAYGGNLDLESTVTIILVEQANMEILKGKHGEAGNGGIGGVIGDPSGDKHGDLTPPEGREPLPGENGVDGAEITDSENEE